MSTVTETGSDFALAVDRGIIQCLCEKSTTGRRWDFGPRAAGKIHKVEIARLTHELQRANLAYA
jgi:hypothetical protein